MKTCFALCAILCVLCVETSAVSAPFRAPSTRPIEHVPGCLWQEAEAFDDYGDWKLDTQFTHKIGSAVLVCPGLDKPTEHPARTTVSFPHAGLWRVWVRTRDWIPEFSPGVPVSALRVTVTKTWGVPEARILEIRAYARHARGGARGG